jgi:hypothetical protein
VIPLAVGAAMLGFAFGRITKGGKGKTPTVSPLSGVEPVPWERFIAKMAVTDKRHVGRKGKLGAFQMDARRLADVGAMRRAWKGPRGEEVGAWVGEWAPGLTEDGFLGSIPLQYAVFIRSMRATAPKVSPLVGKVVDGKVATLSGLLGVSHVAGERGVEGFVKDASIRTRFPSTVEMFSRTNGIF